MLSGIDARSGWATFPILFGLSLNGITVLRWFFAVFFGPAREHAEGVDLLNGATRIHAAACHHHCGRGPSPPTLRARQEYSYASFAYVCIRDWALNRQSY